MSQLGGASSVSHTVREKTKLLNRVSRLRGQIEAIERALEREVECAEILQLIVSARGAMNGLMAEVMEDHIRLHVLASQCDANSEQARGAEELIDVVRAYLKEATPSFALIRPPGEAGADHGIARDQARQLILAE